jgi:hypothetical protein
MPGLLRSRAAALSLESLNGLVAILFIALARTKSIMHAGVDVGAVHCGMASSGPTTAFARQTRMVNLANEEQVRRVRLHLRMTLQTKIIIRLHQKLAVDRAVRGVADGATFAHCFMLEHERARLLAMTSSAGLIEACHGQPAGRLHDIAPMRVMALHTVHAAFDDGMVLREIELSVHFEVAVEANRRILAGIDDGLAPSRRLEVFARGSMTGFAPGKAGPLQVIFVKAGVWAVRKKACNIPVAIDARLVADKRGALDFGRRHHRVVQRRTRA